MIRYRVLGPPEFGSLFARLPPSIRQKLHAGLRLLEIDPLAGKPLERELTGYRSYAIHPYRIIYRVEASQRVVHIIIVAHRREVYDLLIHQLYFVRDRSKGKRKTHYRRLVGTPSLLR